MHIREIWHEDVNWHEMVQAGFYKQGCANEQEIS
jgi:hypothetical protein